MDKDTDPVDGLAIAADAADAAVGLLPLDMLAAVADLVEPAAVAREMPWLAGELTEIALGRSDISFDRRDQRFSDQAWRTIPYFRIMGQCYRLFEMCWRYAAIGDESPGSATYPADSMRYDRWYAPPSPTDPDEWLSTAPVEKGSWWRPWTEWLTARSGPERKAPATLGSRQYPPLGPAPGTYVYQ